MRDEAGFTLIEVLVTVLVLTIGLLGAFATLRASAHATLTNRERQAETSLAREVLEDAGSLSPAQLTSTALPGALQPLIAGASAITAGLQVPWRADVTASDGASAPSYRVTLSVCSLDDASDGYGSVTSPLPAGGSWCTPPVGGSPVDSNPDDEERVSVTIEPSSAPAPASADKPCPSASSYACVKQSTLVVNGTS